VSRRTRIARYGASIAVALVGVACGALIPGTAGGTAATVLVGIGLVGIVSLLFYEVGLTEDRDRAAGEGGGDGSAPSAAPEIPHDGERPRASPSSGGPGRKSARPHARKRLREH
jgi:hypothetical protein